MPITTPVGGHDNSPVPAYVLPTVHHLTTLGTDANNYPNQTGYKLFGRTLEPEMAAGIAAYAANTTNWATANTTAKAALITDTTTQAFNLRATLKLGFTPQSDPLPGTGGGFVLPGHESFATLVPTLDVQRQRLSELALAAKSLLESPEIDETQNAQLAAGLSAAMGGGHSAVPAIKDNITFEQKLQAKQLAFATYAQALDTYYKTFTASAMQIGQIVNPTAMQVSAGTPTVVPYESQLAGDIFANWQDTLNTGQMRDQQIRQTVAGSVALEPYFTRSTSYLTTQPGFAYPAMDSWNAETAASVMGVRSQYKAAVTY